MLKNIFFDSWGCLRNGWLAVVIMVVVLVITASLLLGIVYAINKIAERECSTYTQVTGRSTTFRFMECYVLSPKGWIPRSEFERRAVTNEK